MGKKKFDPDLVSSLVARGTTEARQATQPKAKQTSHKQIEKKYLSVRISTELIDAVYAYATEYRRTKPQESGLHPGVGGAVERLLRGALNLKPL